tara:strand:- start:54 stop:356 length:303 start_codon:yes stop_codon:yes gene_type:complete
MITIILSNIVLYVILRIHLVRKFRTTYSIYLKDEDGNRQTLAHTIAYLLETVEIQNKKIAYLVSEMEKQWMTIEQVKLVTGADKYCTEHPERPPEDIERL